MNYRSLLPAFAHRHNRDGTTDSVCKSCFATVGKSFWETELEQLEQEHEHQCDPDHKIKGVQPSSSRPQMPDLVRSPVLSFTDRTPTPKTAGTAPP